MDLVDFITRTTIDENTMKMNVHGLVDGFTKNQQRQEVLEVAVFPRTSLSETCNVSAICFVMVVFCLDLVKVSKRHCLRHCYLEPFDGIRAFNINTITKS